MKFILAFCLLLITYASYSQDEALMKIINAVAPLEFRQTQIDSLIKKKSGEKAGEELAEFYHDLASKWFYIHWWENGEETDLKKALLCTRKAYDIKKNLSTLSKGSLEKTLFNMAFFNYLLGKVFIAQDYYQLLIETGKDKQLIQKANRELGILSLKIGDFYSALEYFENIISKDEKISRNENILVEVHLYIADTYSQMGIKEHSAKIKNHLTKADSLLQKSGIDDFYFTDDINHTEGDRLLEIGQFKEAILSHQKVLQDSANLYDYDINLVLNSLAQSHIKLNQFSIADSYLLKAIEYNADNSNTYENIGDLFQAQNYFKNALFNYQKAIIWATNKNNEIKINEQPTVEEVELSTNKLFLLNHLVAKANCWLGYYKYDKDTNHLSHALASFTVADKLVDIIRSESTENRSKLFWREKGASLYAKAVEVCYLLNKPEDAYYFMERNKALLLLEDISNEQAKEIAKLPKNAIQREFELKRAILLSENEFKNFESASFGTLDSIKQRVYENKRIYNTYVDSLAQAFPEYANIKKKVDILPHNDFKTKYISKDEAVLQYILNDEQGYGLLTTDELTTFFRLEDVENLNDKIITLYGQLTDLVTDRNKLADFNALSNQVFSELVPASVYDAIKGKKLTLITDYILQQIPFEAFVVNSDNYTYFIEDTEIRYAYSLSYLDAKKQVVNNPKKELFALAPVQFASLGLPELLFSKSEVGEAENIFPGKVALNGEATKAIFLRNINDSRIIHLSTHADVGEGGDPWIAFSDKKMFLNEIYASKNQAEMVVLSACNTSIGELKKGEGAMSLARGFFHSGAKSVVSSLWSTNDKSSKELMVAFYKGLDRGLTKSAAMRKAKIDYIDKYRGTSISPAYWSALIVIGDNSPISSTGNHWSLWLWAILGILVLSVLYSLAKRKKTNS